MSKVDDEIRLANAQYAQERLGTAQEFMAELERNRIAGENAKQDSPILAEFKARRRAQAVQFKSVLNKVLLGRA